MNFSSFLHWAIIFLVIAVISGILGFGGIAGTSFAAARVVLWLALISAAVAFIFGTVRKA